ncbi:hypothetical protein [Lactococcus lactis]
MTEHTKTNDELFDELQENIQMLQLSCNNYDAGKKFVSIDIATRLRVLLHDTKQSTSLLSHLGHKNIKFLNTAYPIDYQNLMPDYCLVGISYSSDDDALVFLPFLHTSEVKDWIEFDKWWTQPIYRNGSSTITRKQLILQIANKGGGAHSDGTLSETFYSFSKNTDGWRAVVYSKDEEGNEVESEGELMGNLHYASLRQIAYEFLESISKI